MFGDQYIYLPNLSKPLRRQILKTTHSDLSTLEFVPRVSHSSFRFSVQTSYTNAILSQSTNPRYACHPEPSPSLPTIATPTSYPNQGFVLFHEVIELVLSYMTTRQLRMFDTSEPLIARVRRACLLKIY
jgi:hypothetical protein